MWGALIIIALASYAAAVFAFTTGVQVWAIACGFVVVSCLLVVLGAALVEAFDIEKDRE